LPNVIDINWELQDGMSIAPSSKFLNVLPTVTETKVENTNTNNSSNTVVDDVPPPVKNFLII
jgi:hypothetical protein